MTLAPRIAMAASIVALVASVVTFVAVLMLNAFVFDEYDAYGEVVIPGSGTVDLPAGEATISFHTVLTGRPVGGGVTVPRLRVSITPPAGAPDPELTEVAGGTTTVNDDARVQVWVVQVFEAGTYRIVTDGEVNGYIMPRLAFGRDGSLSWPLWASGGLLAVGIAGLMASVLWSAKAGKKTRPLTPEEMLTLDGAGWTAAAPSAAVGYQPTDHGVRLEQLKTLAALRDSGALTDAEFEAEKRRILSD